MTLEGLLAIAGIIVAVYALAQPVQRRTIGLFVPIWLVPGSLAITALLVLWKEGASILGYQLYPWVEFTLVLVSFLLPVIATVWAIYLWTVATLTPRKDTHFREYLLACLRESRYDELVRILQRNEVRLAQICQYETASMLFDPYFIQAMVNARTWIHLKLLTNEDFCKLLSNLDGPVDRTIRALLLSDSSPLRTSVLLELGDEVAHYTEEMELLIEETFANPQWFHRCQVGYSLSMAACDKIASGDLDTLYNQSDVRYGTTQGYETRSRCSIFLVEKTIVHILKYAINRGNVASSDVSTDASYLWSIFNLLYEHSKYTPEAWDPPSKCGDYPTPFGYLIAEILGDFRRICAHVWHKSKSGAIPPDDSISSIIWYWAFSVMNLSDNENNVSPRFCSGKAVNYLDMTLMCRDFEVRNPDNKESQSSWSHKFVEHLKTASESWNSGSMDFLTDVINSMDICKEHIRNNHQWLRDELGLPPRPLPYERYSPQ